MQYRYRAIGGQKVDKLDTRKNVNETSRLQKREGGQKVDTKVDTTDWAVSVAFATRAARPTAAPTPAARR